MARKQQHSHVPEFGNWENNNVPYTAFFEDARKEKVGVRMNPNDPEDNPEAFAFANVKGWAKADDDYGKASPVNSERCVGEGGRHHRNRSSDKSNPEYLGRQSSGSLSKWDGDGTKAWSQSNSSFSPKKSPRHFGQTLGSRQGSDSHRRTASIPKFGAWDETDPKSGESFTVIFDRVKKEKQSGSARFRAIPPQQVPLSYIPGSPRKQGMATSCASKVKAILIQLREMKINRHHLAMNQFHLLNRYVAASRHAGAIDFLGALKSRDPWGFSRRN